MARIKWVKLRLNNWALWKASETSGSLGWHSMASFLREGTSDRYRESVIPVDDVDAALTNQAVESLKPARGHLYATLQAFYPQGLGILETARRQGKGESTIKAHLEEADHALRQWFTERDEARERAALREHWRPRFQIDAD